MVFRKENKTDAFQRQMSALRHQLGGAEESQTQSRGAEGYPEATSLRSDSDASRGGEYQVAAYDSSPVSGFNFSGFGAAQDEGTMAVEPVEDQLPQTPVVTDQTSVVAHDTSWKGEFESQGSVHVHGHVEGSIRAREDIFVAEEADVDATINAANVIIAGLVKGNIRCGTRFEVLPQGRVTGDFFAPSVVIHEGAHVNGQFRMSNLESQPQAGEGQSAPVVQQRAARGSA
ncbi:MAG TPA: polymer-forming cytoskeletal protein [Thermomicrobiales bacterium]|nr:polymer-forming cytoskeletal protein [Thermomicrobiales bacterium]